MASRSVAVSRNQLTTRSTQSGAGHVKQQGGDCHRVTRLVIGDHGGGWSQSGVSCDEHPSSTQLAALQLTAVITQHLIVHRK